MAMHATTTRRRRGRPLAVGALLVLAHAALGAALVHSCRRVELVVRLGGGGASWPLEASWPDELADRVRLTVDGQATETLRGEVGPGLHRVEWSVAYRGGFAQRVGATQLVGPFQRPEAPPCGVRLIVGQAFLDDGQASPGTIAHLVKQTIDDQMRGFEQWPLGAFRGVRAIAARWVASADAADPAASAARVASTVERATGAAGSHDAVAVPAGFGVVTLTLGFSDGKVPIEVMLVPVVRDDQLVFDTAVDARLALDSWAYQKVSDLLGGDRVVTRIARRELNAALVAALAPPPPLDLSGGRTIRVSYCPQQPAEIVSDGWAALPMAVAIAPGPGGVLPVAYGAPDLAAALPAAAPAAAPLAVELDLDAVNALLHELWRTGFLDEQLADAGLEARFNADPLVQELLSVRIGGARLALPPTVVAAADGFGLGAETTLEIDDAGVLTRARLWGTIGFDFTAAPDGPASGPSAVPDNTIAAQLRLAALALTCEPRPGELRPCYGDLVDAARGNADGLHGELTRRFGAILTDLFVSRDIGAPGQPAHFTIERIGVAATPAPPSGRLRVDLYGTLYTE